MNVNQLNRNQKLSRLTLAGLTLPSLGYDVAGLNIASEVSAMTMSRHIVFGAVIGIVSKSIFEEEK
jgi:hypothetical protein